MNRNKILAIQKALNISDLAYLGALLSKAKKDTPIYNQVLFAMNPKFDNQRLNYSESSMNLSTTIQNQMKGE